jgi:type III restriction enzyme
LPGVPNVCLRLPTGGGKTLLAAHTVAVAGRHYLERDYPVVLWLVPTNTIRVQTAEASQEPRLIPTAPRSIRCFDGAFRYFDISEITQIRPQDLTDRVSIIVVYYSDPAQSATPKVAGSMPTRKISSRISLMFQQAIHAGPWNGAEDGSIKFSFVNLMAFHRPLVIVDEAHKAGTNLSFEMLAALRPSCIVEFTATPTPTRATAAMCCSALPPPK